MPSLFEKILVGWCIFLIIAALTIFTGILGLLAWQLFTHGLN